MHNDIVFRNNVERRHVICKKVETFISSDLSQSQKDKHHMFLSFLFPRDISTYKYRYISRYRK